MEEHVPFGGYAIAINNKKQKHDNGRLCSFAHTGRLLHKRQMSTFSNQDEYSVCLGSAPEI